MKLVLIGNIIALLASIVMIMAGYAKKKTNIILLQTIQMSLFVVSNLVLGGIGGAIINFANVVRNILCYKNKLTNTWIIIISVLLTIFTLMFNNLGFVGLLPLTATLLYTILINTKSTIKLKIIIIITMVAWLIYDSVIKSYTSAIFDASGIIVNLVSIYQLLKIKKKNKKSRKNKSATAA